MLFRERLGWISCMIILLSLPYPPVFVIFSSGVFFSADEDIDSTYPTNVVVSSNGDCLWVPPGLFLSTCKINIAWFPFDDQECAMKFGSWTYDGSAINLQLQAESGDTSSFITNGEWELVGKISTCLTLSGYWVKNNAIQYLAITTKTVWKTLISR